MAVFSAAASDEDQTRDLRDFERHGDLLSHRTCRELGHALIPAINREEVYELAHQLDDSVDYAEEGKVSHFFVPTAAIVLNRSAVRNGDWRSS
ncbi:MAG: hypothetical protein ACJ789_04995 [Thermomicrobiales bacterium]